jgi:DNA mismatch repair protein MutS2
MKLYPESAPVQLEFDKIKNLLHERCQSEYARNKVLELRIHTKKEFIDKQLKQSYEYKQILQNTVYFPNDFVLNLAKYL